MAQRRLLSYEVLKSTKGVTYSKQHLRRLEKAGEFPRRVPIGENRYGYVEDEVDAWLEAKIAARDEVAAVPDIIVEREDGRSSIRPSDETSRLRPRHGAGRDIHQLRLPLGESTTSRTNTARFNSQT